MNPDPVCSVACYMARSHGLAGLESLLESDRYRIAAILTHRRLPKAEDARRRERPEFSEYERLAARAGTLLVAVDSEDEQRAAVTRLTTLQFDAIASISWRRLLSPAALAQPRLGGVNLHRGALPKYKGAEPVLRALRDGVDEVEICAHILTEEIDAGPVLARVTHPAHRTAGETVEAAAERIKREITPLFGPLLITALDRLVARRAD